MINIKYYFFLMASILALGVAHPAPLIPRAYAEGTNKAGAPGPRQDATTTATIRSIQTLLARLGYDAGPADGTLGARTLAAIRDFQRARGLRADGRPSASLLHDLAARMAAVTPSAAAGPAPAPNESVPLIGTTWEFMDASGSIFRARFEPDGSMLGPGGDLRFWKWSLTADGIAIVFDNRMGTQIRREGRFVDQKWLNGTAESSSGRRWDWVANRLPDGANP